MTAPGPLYDAAIVGAGPGGAAAAVHLARADRRVVLLDKAAFPRDKPCAEYLSPAVTGASTAIGYVIVAGLVASSVVAGAVATTRRRQFRDGLTAAIANAVTEYLVWYPTVLACYYVFNALDANRVDRVWRAEGTYDDFARSAREG